MTLLYCLLAWLALSLPASVIVLAACVTGGGSPEEIARGGTGMSKDKVDKMIVDAIIGDIVDLNFDDDEFMDITDEEIAELDALPVRELTPEEDARFKATINECMAWLKYRLHMEALGLPYLDLYEWHNMAEKPTVPSEEQG